MSVTTTSPPGATCSDIQRAIEPEPPPISRHFQPGPMPRACEVALCLRVVQGFERAKALLRLLGGVVEHIVWTLRLSGS